MKKLILMMLVLVCGIGQVSATKRIYVKTDGNWIQYNLQKETYLYVYTKDTETAILNSWPGNKLTEVDASWETYGIGLFYIDIEDGKISDDTAVMFIINDGKSSGAWQTSGVEGTLLNNTTLYWYSSDGSGNSNVSIMPDKYFFVEWTNDENNRTLTEVTLSNNSFSIDVNIPTTDTYYCIAPSRALNNTSENIDYWKETILPVTEGANYEINAFQKWNGTLDKTNSYCWKYTTGLTTKSTFTANLGNNTFTVTPYFTRTIKGAVSNDSYYATFSSPYAVALPTGFTAYYANKAESGSGKVKMTAFASGIAGSTGAFVKQSSEEVEYTFEPSANPDDIASNNLFVAGTDEGVAASAEGSFNYVFAKQGSNVGFYKVGTAITSDMTGKAYIHSDASLAPSETEAHGLNIEFEDGTSGIYVVENVEMNTANPQVYNLAGQQVAQPTKGLYIVNGKKYIVK